MLMLLYFALFLAVSAALTWWRVNLYRRHLAPLPRRVRPFHPTPMRR